MRLFERRVLERTSPDERLALQPGITNPRNGNSSVCIALASIFVCIYVRLCMSTHIYAYIYLCLHSCVHTYTCTHTQSICTSHIHTYLFIYIAISTWRCHYLSHKYVDRRIPSPPVGGPLLGICRFQVAAGKGPPSKNTKFFKGGCLPPAFGTRTVPKRRTPQGGISCNEYI